MGAVCVCVIRGGDAGRGKRRGKGKIKWMKKNVFKGDRAKWKQKEGKNEKDDEEGDIISRAILRKLAELMTCDP